ncbi:MAG: hypothetical protein WD988_04735 [Candidatus Curtissbacteria bacterium]
MNALIICLYKDPWTNDGVAIADLPAGIFVARIDSIKLCANIKG